MNQSLIKGIALLGGKQNERKSVEITIERDGLSFSIKGKFFKWNYSQIRIEIGGNNKNLLYIHNKQEENITLYTRDKSLVNHEYLRTNPHLQSASASIKRHTQKRCGGYVGFFAGFALLVGLLVVNRAYFVKSIADTVPVSWEEEMGDKLLNTLSGHYNIQKDSITEAYLDSIFLPLTNAVNDTTRTFHFYVCNDTTLNAFALPGGHVVINKGTLAKAESSEELFGVVAHELAHVTQRHHIRGVVSNIGIFVLFQGMIGGEAGLIGVLSESSLQLGSMIFSRAYEYEADNTGLSYLNKANIDPSGMIRFFERIEKMQKEMKATMKDAIDELTNLEDEKEDLEEDTEDSDEEEMYDKLESYLSTHPPTVDRIANVESQVEGAGNFVILPTIESIRARVM